MDHWNSFPPSEQSFIDYNRSMSNSSTSSVGSRYGTSNGHGSSNSSGFNSSNILGSYGSALNSPTSPMGLQAPLSNPHSPSMNNMNPYGCSSSTSSSMNTFNSSSFNNPSSLYSSNSSASSMPNASGGSAAGCTPFNLNNCMPPPSNNFSGQPPMGQNSVARNRYGSSYYDQPQGNSYQHSRNGPTPAAFPPAPPPNMAPANNGYYGNASAAPTGMYNGRNSGNMYQQPMTVRPPTQQPPTVSAHQSTSPSNYYSDNSTSASSTNNSFPPVSDFKIGTFTLGANGVPIENSESSNRSYSNSSNTNGNSNSDANQNVRETGIIEKLLQTYGFIQCCERQARLFFHFSQFDGNTDHLRIGDPVEFEVTFDRRTGKPIASTVQKISPEVVLSEERVVGAVTTELHIDAGGGETQGRISYENRGECFFLPYGKDDVEGYVTLKSGDKVSFQIATNQRTGNLAARHVRLEDPVAPVRYQGVVSAIKDAYGFIERADVVDEIYFNVSDTKHIPGGLKLGDDVDFCITMQGGKEVAIELVKLQDGSVVFEDTSQEVVRGQVLKTVERSPRHNPKEPLPGRIRYRGIDRSEVEVKFGERDQRGEFTLRHGDWVEFNIATDRRDRLQKATNITLLDDSFSVSGERREHGVVKHLIQECGYILCCDRDLLLHFHYRELLDPSTPVTVGDELSFTVATDTTLTGPRKETATRIARLAPGTVSEGVLVQDMLQGQVNVVADKAPPLLPPNNPGSVVPPKELTGEILYLVEGARQVLGYALHDSYPELAVGDKVRFNIQLSKRHKKMVATDLTLMSEVKVPTQPPAGDSSTSVAPETNAENSVPVSAAPSEQLAPPNEHTGDFAPVAAVNGSSPKVNSKKASSQKNGKQPRQSYQGYVAALKESFGFIETLSHDKEIFFHFSNVEGGDSTKLELGDEVEYSLSSRTGPGGKVSAENISLLPKGTLPQPKVLETVYNGLVIRPIRSSNPDQTEYCGLLAVDTDDVERSEQYKFGISGVVRKRELLQKADTVTFQVDATGWATNITAVRKKLIATVDTVKGQYGFLNYEAEEGKKLFFHQSEVKDKTTLNPGDEVEFVIITNQKTGKSSACNISRIMSVGGQSKRPQRLISQLKTMSLDQSKPRLIVVRQPKGPDGTKGFSLTREQLALNFAGLAF